jgi:hypothetical protein
MKRLIVTALALMLAVPGVLLRPYPAADAATGEGRVIVELSGYSKWKTVDPASIANLDASTRQAYKYSRERHGAEFYYTLSGLTRPTYDLELSCVETDFEQAGKRVFDVKVNGATVVSNLDLYATAGKNTAWQRTLTGRTPVGGVLEIAFVASVGEASVSNLRFSSGGTTMLELAASESRHWSSYPLRFIAGAKQDVHEVALGKMGSRCMINPTPQLLGWRQSSLGTFTEDLSELALAFREPGGAIRCLPFTDRYPLFESIMQEDTLTGVVYTCDDPTLPFRVEVKLRAPFYPGDEKISTAPFFYLDLKVTNKEAGPVAGEFLLVRPHKDDNTGLAAPQKLSGTASGYRFVTRYDYEEGSYNLPSQGGAFSAWEALAVDDVTDFTWHYTDITDDTWVWSSPSGYPMPYPQSVYTFRPKGYSGAEWNFTVGGGASESRTLALASYIDQPVLKVKNDFTYKYLYTDPAGPAFTSIESVTDYALGADRAEIDEKTSFFDSTISDANLQGFSDGFRQLSAVAFQGYIINTWWCYNSAGNRWFSVWEGNCNFHSTVDVEYNTAWFYLDFWPDLLSSTLQEWTDYEKSNAQGIYLSHDIGRYAHVFGQTYPHDMPVEENANWLLLMYAYWRQTGDTAFMQAQFAHAGEYADFILACDTDGDGLPDINTANTIDQGSPSVQTARNQTYLGIKSLAALQAAKVMAAAQTVPDLSLVEACQERIETINHTLGEHTWQGDRFLVCDDPSISRDESEAYSIYATNGLLWLLSISADTGLDQDNLDRLRTDLASAAAATQRLYGSIHSSVNNENEWVSQNIWRDAIGFYLGVDGWPAGQEARNERYWNLEKYFATKLNGGFWDALDYYGNYRFNGASEAMSLGLQDGQEALSYLDTGNLANGGARGACVSQGQVYGQSLGYYPRGVASLSLISAAAGLRLDRVDGKVLYRGTPGYGRVPVLACADWGNPVPAARMPVLQFDANGNLTGTSNPSLLPATPRLYKEAPLTDVKVEPATISPDGDGKDDQTRVSFTSPTGIYPATAVIMRNSTAVRTITPSGGAYPWDGKDTLGRPVEEGIYHMRFEAIQGTDGTFTPATEVAIGVNTVIPGPSRTWYLAEGYTGQNEFVGDFETWILVQNPNPSPANLTLTLMQPGGETVDREFTALPNSRLTISVDEILPAAECSARIQSDQDVVVERAMYFNDRMAGHATIGVTNPAENWYLAEGYTGGNFDEWILIQNPGDTDAATTLYLRPQGGNQVTREYNIPAHSRQTVHVDEILEDAQVSAQVSASAPVVVERAQYLNDYFAGTCTIAARNASYQWYFAEGYTGGGFEEWVLVQNPNSTPATVRFDFMEQSGARTSFTYDVAPSSRFTVPAHEILPERELSVSISSDLPIVAERAMYWGNRIEGHATIGTPAPDYGWCFAEGYTAEGFEEWLLIANPGPDPCLVDLTFLFPDGTSTSYQAEVGARSRYTLEVKNVVGEREVSIRVQASARVVAERAQYFSGRAGGTCTIGALY